MTKRRLKTYNHTARRDNLTRNVGKVVEGEVVYKSKGEMLEASGYKKSNREGIAQTVQQVVEEVYPQKERTVRIMEIGRDREDDAFQKRLELETLKELNKMQGSYAAERVEVETTQQHSISDLQDIISKYSSIGIVPHNDKE
jgi:hypothetical protein